MTDATYNGWRNRATWAVGLHLMDTVTNWICDDLESWGKEDDLESAVSLFQDLLAEQEEAANISEHPLLCDLLDTSDIDWQSLAKAALEAAEV